MIRWVLVVVALVLIGDVRAGGGVADSTEQSDRAVEPAPWREHAQQWLRLAADAGGDTLNLDWMDAVIHLHAALGDDQAAAAVISRSYAWRGYHLPALAGGQAARGDMQAVNHTLQARSDIDQTQRIQMAVMNALVATGQMEQALAWVDGAAEPQQGRLLVAGVREALRRDAVASAEALLERMDHGGPRNEAVAELVLYLAQRGSIDQATALLGESTDSRIRARVARLEIDAPMRQVLRPAWLGETGAALSDRLEHRGDLVTALRRMRSAHQARDSDSLAAATAEALEQAQSLVRGSYGRAHGALALVYVAMVQADIGDAEGLVATADRAFTLIQEGDPFSGAPQAFSQCGAPVLTVALARSGRADAAVALINRTWPHRELASGEVVFLDHGLWSARAMGAALVHADRTQEVALMAKQVKLPLTRQWLLTGAAEAALQREQPNRP